MKSRNSLAKGMFTLLFVIFAIPVIFAQTPPADLTGEALKTWLKQNYYDGNHVQLGYDNARMHMYNYIDNHNNTLTGVYSGLEVSWTYGGTGTNPAPLNCEHTIPQSFFGYAEPMVSDIHHLFPTYLNWNSTRSNYPFAEIDDNVTVKWMYLDQSITTIPTSNIDLYSEYANSSFEPREDHKGDCARSIFYFYTMYPTQAGDINSVCDINTLYQWHLDDPISAKEIQRNTDIQTYQGDLNPYVALPELVARAWGFVPVDPSVPATPTLVLNATVASLDLNWNNVFDENGYRIYKSDDGTNYSLLVDVAANSSSYQDIAVVEAIVYSYYIIAYNDFGNSTNSNIVSGQLQSGSGSSTELLFSEYIEGSSYNKALEIANFTGASVDLSAYSIFKQTNGAGDWASELALSGTIAHGDVYVVAHSSSGAEIQAVADLLTGSQALTFNGNDALALFKSGVQIDQIGIFNSATNYAIDVTMVRKSVVTTPNTTYTTSEWDVYGTDTFTYLGSHTMDVGATDTEAPTIPAGLSASAITETTFTLSWSASSDNVGVSGYDVFKDGIYYTSTASTTFGVSGLSAGTSYSMTVKAKDAAGNISAASTALNVTTVASDTEAPTIPTGLLASAITETTFTMTWNASTDNVGVSGYDVFKDGIFYATTASTSAGISGLLAGTSYLMTVKAKDAVGNISAASTALNVTTIAPDTEAPSIPLNLSASLIADNSFTLNWNASTDNVAVTAYDVFKDGIYYGSTASTSYSISGLSASTSYSMTVKAKDAVGNISAASTALNVTTTDSEAPSIPDGLVASNITETSFTINWNASTDNVGVSSYDVYKDGAYLSSGSLTNMDILGLTAGMTYDMTVIAKDAAGNSSLESNSLLVTTTSSNPSTGPASDLIISEYIEGSSYNKAIEIANFTGVAVDLSAYSLMKQTNGAGLWANEYILSGTLADGDVFVIANSSASASITAQADVVTSALVMTFNGNDALGLFKNSSLLDMLGVFNSSVNYAIDVTMVRKSSIVSPNSTYDVNEWLVYTVDEFAYLGSHTMDDGTQDTEAPSIPTGLSASTITENSFTLNWNTATDNVAVTEYDVFKNGILYASTSLTSYGITGLAASTSYAMTVKAKDAAGNISAASTVLNVITDVAPDTEAPSVPTGLIASAITETSFTLDWNASTDNVSVTGYEVYQDGSFLGSSIVTTYDVSGLSAGIIYDMTVIAIDAANNSSAASTSLFVTTNQSAGTGPVELLYTDFESGFDIWTVGGRDCSLYTSGGYAPQGSNAANIQDNSGISSSFYLTNGIDIQTPGYTDLTIDFTFIPVSMEYGEDFFVEFFDGSNWNVIANFANGFDFDNYYLYSVSLPVSELDYNFSTDMNIRFLCDASGNRDDIYVDEIRLTASDGTLKLSTQNKLDIRKLGSVTPLFEDIEFNISLYPSPAIDQTTLAINSEDEIGNVEIQVIDVHGRIISSYSEIIADESVEIELDVSYLNKGLYFVMVRNVQFKMTKKLIVN